MTYLRLRREFEASLPIQNRFLNQLLNNLGLPVAPKDSDKNSDRTIIVNVSPSDTNWFVTARNRRKEWRIQQQILGTKTTTPYLDLGNEVIAYRGWELAFDGQKFSLVSGYLPNNQIWTPRETTTASCAIAGTLHSNETIPVEECTCGIYAAKDPMGSVGSLVGSVTLWGKYAEHELGWRAQHAYPKELLSIRCSKCKTLSPFKECSISIFTTTGHESRAGISVTCYRCPGTNNDDSYRIPASLVIEEISSLYSLEVK